MRGIYVPGTENKELIRIHASFPPRQNIKCVIWWTKKGRLSIILYKTWYKSGDSTKNFLLLQLVTKELIYK